MTRVLPVAFSFANIFAWYFFQWMKMAGNSLAYNNNDRKYNPLLNYCIVLENIHPTPHNSNWACYFSLKTLPFNYTLFCCWWDYLDLKLLTRWWKNVHKEMQAKPIWRSEKPCLQILLTRVWQNKAGNFQQEFSCQACKVGYTTHSPFWGILGFGTCWWPLPWFQLHEFQRADGLPGRYGRSGTAEAASTRRQCVLDWSLDCHHATLNKEQNELWHT